MSSVEKKAFVGEAITQAQVEHVEHCFRNLQDHLSDEFSRIGHGQHYFEEQWNYEKGSGGGRSRVWAGRDDWSLTTDQLTKENIDKAATRQQTAKKYATDCPTRDQPLPFWEKGGCNWSGIHGNDLPAAALQKWDVDVQPGTEFVATGVSIVLHPSNPWVPSIHANIRFFHAGGVWWFGGGIDLTPYYPLVEQVAEFHDLLAELYDSVPIEYAEHKEHCDRYFYLKHRKETRGVGGVFYDALPHGAMSFDEQLSFALALGRLLPRMLEIFAPNVKRPFLPSMRNFQLYRRGRYVEFNLLFDRGTRFGIVSGGRTESILMSLPATVHFDYNWTPAVDSMEHFLYEHFLQPQNWHCRTIDERNQMRRLVVEPAAYAKFAETEFVHTMASNMDAVELGGPPSLHVSAFEGISAPTTSDENNKWPLLIVTASVAAVVASAVTVSVMRK